MGSSLCRSIHDVTGHDVRAAVSMSQVRNMLRDIACDRREPPNVILRRFGLAHHPLRADSLGIPSLRGGVEGAEVQGRAVWGDPSGLPCRAGRGAVMRKRGVVQAEVQNALSTAYDTAGVLGRLRLSGGRGVRGRGSRPSGAGGQPTPFGHAAFTCVRPVDRRDLLWCYSLVAS
ncbi:SpoIIE family protein phosphatase [Streptomyces sp. NPDC051917]|uniref:SpoIIE family protein phosphatase n=1 Tax=Streptomyces sp. NPDC051917 TaxID=3154754 RepID=UPI00344F4E05